MSTGYNMKTPTEMAIDYLDNMGYLDNRLNACFKMKDDLEKVMPFMNTGAFADLEIEIGNAIEYLESEIKEMENDK